MLKPSDIAIVSGARTPMGRYGGKLRDLTAMDLAAIASKCAIQRKSSEGWNRYYLTGPDVDAICVYLPKKPEKFAGGKLRGGNTPARFIS